MLSINLSRLRHSSDDLRHCNSLHVKGTNSFQNYIAIELKEHNEKYNMQRGENTWKVFFPFLMHLSHLHRADSLCLEWKKKKKYCYFISSIENGHCT